MKHTILNVAQDMTINSYCKQEFKHLIYLHYFYFLIELYVILIH